MVSAHWEEAPLALSATTPVPLVYDFWGFPQRYYDVTYDAPGAPELAADVAALVRRPGLPVHQDQQRGLDHGAYVPLVEMFPEADVPVLQMSMPTLDPQRLFEIGRTLAPLRDQGTLIVGLRLHHPQPGAGSTRAPPRTRRRPRRRRSSTPGPREVMQAGDVDALLDFLHRAPAAREAHPAPSTSRRCSSPSAPPGPMTRARGDQRHRRLLVRPVQALLADRLTSRGVSARAARRPPARGSRAAPAGAPRRCPDRSAPRWRRAPGPRPARRRRH